MDKLLSPPPGIDFTGQLESTSFQLLGKARNKAFSRKQGFFAALLLLISFFGYQPQLFAQTTTITTEAGTGFDGGNSAGSGNGAVTFVIENTNAFPITLTGVDNYWTTAYTGTTPTLWYSSTSLSGAPTITSPTWTSIATGSPVTIPTNGYYQALTNLNFNIPANTEYRFALQSSLGVSYSGSGTAGVPSPNTFTINGVSLKVYDAKIAGSNVGYAGISFPNPPNSPRGFTGRIHFQPALPCTSPPNGGTAVSSATSVCANASFKLSLNNSSFGTGLTYQWQSSPNNTSWTNITGATSATLTTSQTVATYYRAQLSCSGGTPVPSTSVQVTILGNGLSGNFTINKNAAPSATNFQTFAAALTAMSCGVSGPVTFNVVAGSGPYNEQITIPALIGTSATNTVTFEGNGNTITYLPTTSTDAVIKLDGADYVKFNNFKIKMDGSTTAGIVVNMINGANFNTISNSTIAAPTTSTSTLYGVFINASGNNTIENDSIRGAYYTVRIEDVASGTTTVNNQIRNNIIQDNYLYNFYLGNVTGTIIEGNNISRPTRTNGSTFYGIYMFGTSSGNIISKNRIHNTHDAATSLTGSVYGIYFTGDAVAGSENIVKNNLLYNINNDGGAIYALYNGGADGTYYYHNTLALDDVNHTSTLRGLYISSAATNIKFNNNIITLNGSGTTTKHAIYVGVTTATFESNNNDLYVFPNAGAAFTGYYSGDKATLADWKTANANAYDQNSVAVDPRFENRAGGNLKPTSFFVNNVGKPLPAVTDDITGATRSTTTPDLGAYEFTPPAKDVAVTAITSLTSGCGKSNQETVTIVVTNMGTDPQSNIPVQFSLDGITWSTPEIIPGPLASGASVTYTFTAKANLSTPGTFNFQARTQLSGDAIAANDAFTKVVDALPTITSYPYNEGFENGDGGWKASGANSSWALGTPAKTVINSAGSGTKSWVTSLTGTYNINEQSQVISPCMNFSTLQKPLMEMKVWWSSQTSFDGAVLQYSTDNGVTWTNVGAFGDNDWYNDNSINGGPGGQPAGTTSTAEGWSGTGTASSNGWITVKHALPGLQLRPNVRLRIAFGSDASTQNDGFAFDDVKIYDTPQNDMGVIGITQLASGCDLSTTETITITVRNFGLAPQTNIPVSYSLDGVTFVPNEIIPGPVNPNNTASFTFTRKANLSVAGIYNFTACTKLPGDGDPSNDCRSQEVRSIPTITSYPYFQDFETNDGGWVASGTNSTWALGTPNKTVIKGAASGTKAFVTSLTGSYNNSENSVVLGPCFNFSSLTNPQIDMKVWWMSEFSMDGAVLQSSIDNGATWNNVGFNGDPNNWFNDGSINGAPGGQPAATAEGWTGHQAATASNGWVRARHALNGLGGQANVKLRIAFGSNATTVNDGFAFDDILIYEKPTVDALVTSISSFNSGCGVGQETVSIIVENAGTTPINNLVVKFQVTPQFTAPLTAITDTIPGTIAPGATRAFTFNPGKANLSNGGINTVTASTMLTGDQIPQNDATSVKQETIPTVTTYPYIQNFENGDGGWKASGTNSSWAFGTPAKAVIKGAASGVNAWVTSLTGQYNISENSQVSGPCFNFSNLVDPTIEMKIWWNSEFSWDGAVLQSSIDGGTTWQNVGAMGDANAINWYNDNSLNGAPGGQPAATAQGWTGRASTSNGSNGWVTTKHALTGLGGQSSVKLRIAFGSDPSVLDDGFAFDDINIFESSNNLAVTAFAPLTKICGFTNCESVTVTIKNLSSVAITNVPVNLLLGTTQVGTQTVPTIAGNGTVDVVFPCVDLTATGQLTLTAKAILTADPDQTNNTLTTTVTNSLFTTLPQGFSFEPGQKGLNDLRSVTASQSAITESVDASSPLTLGSTKGIVMDAVTGSPWVLPILAVDPWTNNLNNKSGIYMCLPAQPTLDSLWLMFDLKQTFKTANANTNFRVTVNGTMVGTTYRPAVDGTPDVWKTVKVNLTQFKNNPIQIGLESSTKEAYQNGAGTANLVDNVIVRGRVITGTKNEVLQGQLSVFPNPSNGQFNVSLPQGKAYELEVVDLTGRVLKEQTVKGGNSMLDMQGTSQGIYLLKVKSNNATAVRKLIIE